MKKIAWTLAGGFVEKIYEPIIEMQAETEEFTQCSGGDHKKAA